MNIPDPNLFIDIHTHTQNNREGVFPIINLFPGQAIEKLPAQFFYSSVNDPSGFFYSLGWHPWHVKEENVDQIIQLILDTTLQPEILAIGECGLDHLCSVPFQLQQRVFKQQVLIAEQVKKPVLIHCVRAANEIIKLKKEIKPKMPWIIHGFNSNEVTGRELIRHGFYLSLGVDLLKNVSNALKILPQVPSDRLFFETGDWDIEVEKIYQRAAILLDVELSFLKKQIHSNFSRLFPIRAPDQ